MIAYPKNNICFNIPTPIYTVNNTVGRESRYSIYRKIDNLDFPALEIKLTNSISQNETYRGYYYTTTENETLYQVAKKYYDNENFWWIIAKANGLKNSGISILDKGITLSIPAYIELSNKGGYFNAV